jgi:hypothetical protein
MREAPLSYLGVCCCFELGDIQMERDIFHWKAWHSASREQWYFDHLSEEHVASDPFSIENSSSSKSSLRPLLAQYLQV